MRGSVKLLIAIIIVMLIKIIWSTILYATNEEQIFVFSLLTGIYIVLCVLESMIRGIEEKDFKTKYFNIFWLINLLFTFIVKQADKHLSD